MISNPIDNPDFLLTLYVVGSLLGAVLLVLVFLVRFRLNRLGQNILFQRWRTWTIIAPTYALAVLSGELMLLLLITFLVFQGLREYSQLVGLPPDYERVLLALGLLAPSVALLSLDAFLFLPPILLVGATLQPLIFHRVSDGVRHLAFAALGWGCIAWFLTHLMLLYKYVDEGEGIVLAIGLAVALSDVGAFVVGRAFGRRQMAPRISPNKTWEGGAGNFLGAYLGLGLMAFALPDDLLWVLVFALPPVIALGAIWGDLLESVIKREAQSKDAGTWLSGFGGLLDRIDSLLIVAPLVFYVMRLTETA